MTSALVLLFASVLHFGLRGSCFLNIERFPMVPGTMYAGHIAYCAILHFLHDMDVLPVRYRRRMGWLAGFLIELVLGVAVMEVLALWLWCSVEHIAHKTIQFVLRRYVGMPVEVYQQWESTIMGSVMTLLAALLWLNAYDATDAAHPPEVVPAGRGLKTKTKRRHLIKREEQVKHAKVTKTRLEQQVPSDPQDSEAKDVTESEPDTEPEQDTEPEPELDVEELLRAEYLLESEVRVLTVPEQQLEAEHGTTTEC